VTTVTTALESQKRHPVTESDLSRVENGQKPHQQAIVTGVTGSDPPTGGSDVELLELAAPAEREEIARLLAVAKPEERAEIAEQLAEEAS
jgi:hypothetical protein